MCTCACGVRAVARVRVRDSAVVVLVAALAELLICQCSCQSSGVTDSQSVKERNLVHLKKQSAATAVCSNMCHEHAAWRCFFE